MPDHEDVSDQVAHTPDPGNSDARSSQWMLIFLFGMVAGGFVALIAPVLWSAFLLPAPARVEETLVTGVVTDKLASSKRVLLRIESDSGLVAASFVDRTLLVDILVDRGDTVTLSMPAYTRVVEEAHLAPVMNTDSPMAAHRDTTIPSTEDSTVSLESRPD